MPNKILQVSWRPTWVQLSFWQSLHSIFERYSYPAVFLSNNSIFILILNDLCRLFGHVAVLPSICAKLSEKKLR